MLQIILTVLLVVVLTAAVVSFVVMGLSQIRRTRALARVAHKLGLRFSADDPFDLPRRYADFALIANGHSPHANNVTYGRLAGRLVREFDFRYEVGHGTQRAGRHYHVVVLETDRKLPDLLMWNDSDAEAAPLRCRGIDGHVACWSYRGNSALAAALADAREELADQGTSIEAGAGGLMVFTPLASRSASYAGRLLRIVRAVENIDQPTEGPGGQNVENQPN